MVKKQLLIGIISIILVMLIGFSGCVQQNASAESLQTILSKAETIESMYYEIAVSITMSQYGSQTASMKIWQEKPYFKEQISSVTAGISTSILIIVRPEGTYVYDTAQGKYTLTQNIPSYVTALQYLDPKMIKDLLNNQSITDFHTDVIDGKQATIVEYAPPLQGGNLMTIKIWIWNEKGVPLKAVIEMTMEKITMTMNFVFSDYSFADIPDGTFSVS